MIKRLIIYFIFLNQYVYAQHPNIVKIAPTDNATDIIKKAASVTPSPRQLRWQQLEMTAFLHFGINTYTNREWGTGKDDITLFNPVKLDANQWIKTLKSAGFKQVIITAKHHDGFCLWPSKYTDHSVKHAAWKNGSGDVVKEVAEACKNNHIGFGVYLSPWDRNSIYYGDSALYNNYFINQLTELLTNYGKVDEVWFDGANGEGPNGKKQVYDFDRWYQLIRKLQPDAVIAIMGPDVRWVGTESGVGRTTEWSVVPADKRMQKAIEDHSQTEITFAPQGDMTQNDIGSREKIYNAKALVWYPAETDVSIRPGWFYHPEEDGKVKSPQQLSDIYFSSVGRNSVLLLNVPPDKDGLINKNDVRSLEGFHTIIQKSFSTNLLKGAKVICVNGINNSSINDGKYDSYWTTNNTDTTSTIEFDMSSDKIFDMLSLQEYIPVGQRIESFTLEYKSGNEWKKITDGTTVGYKRLIRFPVIKARQVRLHITSSRLNPTLAEIGLYKYNVKS